MKQNSAYVTPVLLLCVECSQPIKATITTSQWIKVEWISPEGTCQACSRLAKEKAGNDSGLARREREVVER